MSSRALIGLAAALAILVGLAVFGHRADTPSKLDADALFLPELKAKLNDVDRVEVVGAGKAPVTTLKRGENGWVVDEKDGYPADISKVRSVLLDLAEAHIVEQKTANPEYYSRLGVEPVDDAEAKGLLLELSKGDTSIAAVTLGNEAGNGYRYVRQDGVAESYLVDKRIDAPREAAKWVVPDIVDVRGDRVRQVTIDRPGEKTLTISKATPEQANFTVENVPEGRELQYPGVANVTGNALRELRLEDVATAEDGASPAVTTTYRTFDGLVVAVKGFEDGDDRWIELEASVDPDRAKQGGQPNGAAEAGKPESASGGSAAAAAKDGSAAAAKDGAQTADDDGAAEVSGEGEASGKDASGSNDAADADSTATDEQGTSSASATNDASDGSAAKAAPDPAAEAERINARVHGWRYRIASYQYDQMTRSMEDLLKAEETAEKKK